MSEAKMPPIIVEGNDDRCVLDALANGDILPTIEVFPKRGDAGANGRDGMFSRLAAYANAKIEVIAVRDFDEGDDLVDWLQTGLHRAAGLNATRIDLAASEICGVSVAGSNGESRVLAIHAGGSGPVVNEFSINLYAIDDCLLELACMKPVFEATFDREVAYDTAMKLLREMAERFREASIKINRSKRLLQLLFAITGFRAGHATFADRVTSKACSTLSKGDVRAAFGGLVTGIEAGLSELSQ